MCLQPGDPGERRTCSCVGTATTAPDVRPARACLRSCRILGKASGTRECGPSDRIGSDRGNKRCARSVRPGRLEGEGGGVGVLHSRFCGVVWRQDAPSEVDEGCRGSRKEAGGGKETKRPRVRRHRSPRPVLDGREARTVQVLVPIRIPPWTHDPFLLPRRERPRVWIERLDVDRVHGNEPVPSTPFLGMVQPTPNPGVSVSLHSRGTGHPPSRKGSCPEGSPREEGDRMGMGEQEAETKGLGQIGTEARNRERRRTQRRSMASVPVHIRYCGA